MIDRLIPREAGLLREGGHCLNELIHLRAQQRLASARLDGFGPIHRTRVPVLHGDPIGRSVNRQPQVVGSAADDKIQRVDAGIVEDLVGYPAAILNEILSLAAAQLEDIVAAAAVDRVVS